jgi:hypothetical protein
VTLYVFPSNPQVNKRSHISNLRRQCTVQLIAGEQAIFFVLIQSENYGDKERLKNGLTSIEVLTSILFQLELCPSVCLNRPDWVNNRATN